MKMENVKISLSRKMIFAQSMHNIEVSRSESLKYQNLK